MVKFKSSWLLVLDDNVSDSNEEVRNLRVMRVELFSSFDSTRGLVGLKNDKERLDVLKTFRHQEFLIKMDSEVFIITDDFEVNNLGLLVLVDPLSHDKCTLGMSLTPLLEFWVIEWKTDSTLSQLVHDIAPKHILVVFFGESKQGVDILELGKVVANGISSAFLIT